MDRELENKIEELESKLIEQEHRPFVILQNYFINRQKWPKNNKKRSAALKALVWSIFFSPFAIALTGGIIAILTLATLLWQNSIIKDQNSIINDQNNFFQKQIIQVDNQYKFQRQTVLKSILYSDKENHRLKRDALIEYLNLQRLAYDTIEEYNPEKSYRPIDLKGVNLDSVDMSDVDLSNVDFGDSSFIYANFFATNFSNSWFWRTTFKDATFTDCTFTRTRFYGMDISGSEIVRPVDLDVKSFCNTQGTPSYFEVDLVSDLKGSCNRWDRIVPDSLRVDSYFSYTQKDTPARRKREGVTHSYITNQH